MTPPVCRVCLQIANDPIDMTFALYRGEIRVTQMFKDCTGVLVQQEKNNILCKECETRLFDAYEFQCQAKEAEKLLNQESSQITNVKDEQMMMDDEEPDFYWKDEAMEPLVSITKKDETIQSETKTKKTSKKRASVLTTGPTNRFQCRFCLKIFIEGLREHEKQHIIDNGGFECHHCPKKFKDRDRVATHLKAVHFSNRRDPNRPRHSCDICGKTYSELSSMRKHKRFVHSETPVPR